MQLAFCIFSPLRPGLEADLFCALQKIALAEGHRLEVFSALKDLSVYSGVMLTLFQPEWKTWRSARRQFLQWLKQQLESRSFDAIIGFEPLVALDLYVCLHADHPEVWPSSSWQTFLPRFKLFQTHLVFSPQMPTEVLYRSEAAAKILQHRYGTPLERLHSLYRLPRPSDEPPLLALSPDQSDKTLHLSRWILQFIIDHRHRFREQRSLHIHRFQSFWPHCRFEIRKDWLAQLSPWNQQTFGLVNRFQGEFYRCIDNRQTLRLVRDGQAFFVKRHQGIGWHEILKNLCFGRLPILGARAEFLAIRRLEQLHISTMPIAAFGERGWNPANQQSFLITGALEPTISLEDYCLRWTQTPPTPVLKWHLINQVAHIAKTIHNHGLNHRDFYICHLLLHLDQFDPTNPETSRLSLIDLHRMQQRRKVPQRWLVKDLAGLNFSTAHIGLNARDRLRFLKAYTGLPLKDIDLNSPFYQKIARRTRQLLQRTPAN